MVNLFIRHTHQIMGVRGEEATVLGLTTHSSLSYWPIKLLLANAWHRLGAVWYRELILGTKYTVQDAPNACD